MLIAELQRKFLRNNDTPIISGGFGRSISLNAEQCQQHQIGNMGSVLAISELSVPGPSRPDDRAFFTEDVERVT